MVSKFIWKASGLIGAQRKFESLCSNDPTLSELHRQDGFKEPILCGDCEGMRGRLEAAIAPIVLTIPTLKFSQGKAVLSCSDYRQMKLFWMFQIWMMGASSLGNYSMVDLGPHSELLRQRLLNGDPCEPWRYGTQLWVLCADRKEFKGTMTQPVPWNEFGVSQTKEGDIRRTNTHWRAYRYLIAGMYCSTLVTRKRPCAFLRDRFVQNDGDWTISKANWYDFPELRDKVKERILEGEKFREQAKRKRKRKRQPSSA